MILSRLRWWGAASGLGLGVALLAFAADLLSKLYLLNLLEGRASERIPVTPFFDLLLSWNRGISYGMLSSGHWLAQPLLVLAGGVILVGLWLWLARMRGRLWAVAFGLVMGGALGNLWDRVRYGAVADFFSFHGWGYSWYIFNVADVWIVCGGGMLIWRVMVGGGQDETDKQARENEQPCDI